MIFSGTSNQKLAKALARETGLKLGRILIERFSDGEIYVRVLEAVKNKAGACHPIFYRMKMNIFRLI